MLCENCKTFMLDLLDKRISKILEVGRTELKAGEDEGDFDNEDGE